jgi:hypothetical protein
VLGLPPEPETGKEALSGSEAPHWRAAMQEEIDNLVAMGTWQAADLPVGRKAIPSKWVFKRKLTATGSIERYRSRLVYYRALGKCMVLTTLQCLLRWCGRAPCACFFSILASQDLESFS